MRAEGDGHEAEDEVDLGRLRGRMLVDGGGGAGTGEGRGGWTERRTNGGRS